MTKTTKRNLIALCIAILLATACFAVMLQGLAFAEEVSPMAANANSDFGGGTGTVDDPYLIYNETHLNNIRNTISYDGRTQSYRISASFKLASSIFMSFFGTWTPIPAYFDGTFDGGNYTIANLKILVKVNPTGTYGLFEKIGRGTVKDLYMVNLIVSHGGDEVDSSSLFVGGIAGINEGTIDNCTIHGAFNTKKLYNASTGGIAGVNEGTVSNCTNIATIAGCGPSGGIVGINWFSGKVTDCVNEGTIEFNRAKEDRYAGGIVGKNADLAIVIYCKNYGKISYVGPLSLLAIRPCMGQIVGLCTGGQVMYFTYSGEWDTGWLSANQKMYCAGYAIGKDER